MGRDLKTYAKAPAFLENPRLYRQYPQLVANLMTGLFTFDLTPKQHIFPAALGALKTAGLSALHVGLDGWNGGRSL